MKPLLATMEFTEFAAIVIAALFISAIVSGSSRQSAYLKTLQRQLDELQRKVDALLAHHGIELPPLPTDASAEVQRLAGSPETKIAAIKLYREQHPGVGLAEAKAKIEAIAEGKMRA